MSVKSTKSAKVKTAPKKARLSPKKEIDDEDEEEYKVKVDDHKMIKRKGMKTCVFYLIGLKFCSGRPPTASSATYKSAAKLRKGALKLKMKRPRGPAKAVKEEPKPVEEDKSVKFDQEK